mmetsp:Transcript_4138/g.11670  ORF Transcript_4138/g.11670 Transcript_4138/m.11670 type:complete len:624 (+) Transcript_4138:51-1922(+)
MRRRGGARVCAPNACDAIPSQVRARRSHTARRGNAERVQGAEIVTRGARPHVRSAQFHQNMNRSSVALPRTDPLPHQSVQDIHGQRARSENHVVEGLDVELGAQCRLRRLTYLQQCHLADLVPAGLPRPRRISPTFLVTLVPCHACLLLHVGRSTIDAPAIRVNTSIGNEPHCPPDLRGKAAEELVWRRVHGHLLAQRLAVQRPTFEVARVERSSCWAVLIPPVLGVTQEVWQRLVLDGQGSLKVVSGDPFMEGQHRHAVLGPFTQVRHIHRERAWPLSILRALHVEGHRPGCAACHHQRHPWLLVEVLRQFLLNSLNNLAVALQELILGVKKKFWIFLQTSGKLSEAAFETQHVEHLPLHPLFDAGHLPQTHVMDLLRCLQCVGVKDQTLRVDLSSIFQGWAARFQRDSGVVESGEKGVQTLEGLPEAVLDRLVQVDEGICLKVQAANGCSQLGEVAGDEFLQTLCRSLHHDPGRRHPGHATPVGQQIHVPSHLRGKLHESVQVGLHVLRGLEVHPLQHLEEVLEQGTHAADAVDGPGVTVQTDRVGFALYARPEQVHVQTILGRDARILQVERGELGKHPLVVLQAHLEGSRGAVLQARIVLVESDLCGKLRVVTQLVLEI